MGVILGFAAVFAAVLLLTVKVMQIRKNEQENQMMQSYMVSLQSFYGIIQERIEATRRYRHDLAKHIQTLEMMQQEGMEEVINSIIAIKEEECGQKQIPFCYQIAREDYSIVRELDMTGILYNLLDNAIEEEERIPKEQTHGICLAMERRENQIWINVTNHIRAGEEISFQTSKEDENEHGIGTKIIDLIVEKYGGKIEHTVMREKNMFSVDVWLEGE